MVKYKKVKREDIFHKDYEIALDFATQTYKQFSEIIKTIVLLRELGICMLLGFKKWMVICIWQNPMELMFIKCSPDIPM